jgi:hypothetical protein
MTGDGSMQANANANSWALVALHRGFLREPPLASVTAVGHLPV